jgi:hypothetical protein
MWQVSRIMRKENFLTAMLNKEVLDLRLPMPWLGQRVMLTKILEWNLYWCARVPDATTYARRNHLSRVDASGPPHSTPSQCPLRAADRVQASAWAWSLKLCALNHGRASLGGVVSRCVLDAMFDDNFLIRRDFLTDERALRRRFRFMAVANVLVRES